MSSKCSPKERAEQLEREILAMVERGEVILHRGTFQTHYGSGSCHACAIGAAALAAGYSLDEHHDEWNDLGGRRACQLAAERRGMCSQQEAMAMEVGFESGAALRDAIARGTMHYFEAHERFPEFFELGERLAKLADNAPGGQAHPKQRPQS